MISKNHTTTLAKRLLATGLSLLAVSFFIQIVFIRNTNFKQQHKARQYQQCLERNTSETCDQAYGI
jgi:uncharacterized membrane protein